MKDVGDFQRAVLRKEDNDRNAPAYKLYFPNGLVHLTRAKEENLIHRMERILAVLEKESDEVVRGFYLVLQKSLKAYKSAAELLEKTELSYEKTFSQELVARAEWHSAYKSCEGELLVLYNGNREQVKEFFLKPSTSRKNRSEDTMPEEENQPEVAGSTKAVS
jgi:hypothetical protein